MPNRWLIYLETVTLTLLVCVGLHYLAHLDWPWALLVGLLAATAVRTVVHRPLR